MFGRLGDLVCKWRWIVLAVMVGVLAVLGLYGTTLADHLGSGGFDDPGSQSSRAARLIDNNFARDHGSDALVLYYAPEGKTIHDPEFKNKVVSALDQLPKDNPAIMNVVAHCWQAQAIEDKLCSKDKTVGAAAIAIKGDNDTESLKNFRLVKDAFGVDGVKTEVGGRLFVAGTINDTIAEDTQRMELIALPIVGILLFFIFGGVVAAALPLIVGGLTIVSAWGLVRVLTHFTDVTSFVSSVVSLIGLGLAIDYGLFIVSRFREELAEGYSTQDAVRRTVMTAGRTVVFSATMIVASLGGMLIFPHGFLKSVAYGSIITVSLAALTAVTVLPAILAILGNKVDALGFKFMRKTKSIDEVERSVWGRLTEWVMRHPLLVALPIVIGLLLLIIPVRGIEFGSISEKYLPPDNSARLAQEHFDRYFPLRSEPIRIAIETDNYGTAKEVMGDALQAPGVTFDDGTVTPKGNPGSETVPANTIWTFNLLMQKGSAATQAEVDAAIDYLRAMPVPENAEVSIGGMRAMERDGIAALLRLMPWMIILVLSTTTLLMFLTFGSLVLPIKAALMSALGLGSTLGILTWIFVDGHGASLLNFTPGPISSPVLVLIIAIIYGLSTDYEVFLLSRMVEARAMGASTTESVRVGTAHTGRIITAAAVILLLVTGAFGFSKMVMMQYIAYGMMAALIIDATLLRMFLVPATMKLLGDDCWWAPAWMKRIQEKSGMGEPILDDARMPDNVPEIISRVNPMLADESMTVEMPGLASVLRAKAGRAFGRNTGANPVVRPGKTSPGRAVAPRATEQQSPPPKRGEGKPPAASNGGSGPLPRPAPPAGSGPLPRPANGSGPVPRPVNSSGPVPRPAPSPAPAPAERPAPPSGSGPLRRPQPPAGATSAPVRRPAPGSGPVAGPQPPRRPGPPPGPRGSGPMPRPARPPAGPAAPSPAGPVPPPRPANGGPADPLRPAPPPQRSGIEQWLADLRQPGRDPGAAGPQSRSQPETDAETTGRHHRNSQSVSVNELLRREHDD